MERRADDGRCYCPPVGVRERGRTVGALLLACHPGPTVVVTVLATAVAVGIGAGPARTVLVAAAVLSGQLSIGWSNDWIDAGRDLSVGRRDKPVVSGRVSPDTLRRSALGAAAVCVPLSSAPGWRAGVVHVACVACGWAYNHRLKSTAWSWLPFALAFGLLPVFVVLARADRPSTAGWAVGAAALLGIGAHLANVLPDLEDDVGHDINGIGHRLGRTATSLLAPTVLVVATALVVLAPQGPAHPAAVVGGAVAAGLAVAAGVVALLHRSSRAPFALTMGVAAVCVALLVMAAPEVALPG